MNSHTPNTEVRLKPDPNVANDPPFAIHVTRDAADRIRSHGGRLFLWNRQVGRGGLRDYVAYTPPSGGEFECYYHAKRDIQICVPLDFPFAEVIVRGRRWPLPGVRVCVNGRRWGWRGEHLGLSP